MARAVGFRPSPTRNAPSKDYRYGHMPMTKGDIFGFLKIRAVPSLFWSAPRPLTIRPPVVSVVMLAIGIVTFGLGEALLIASGVGVSPWTVLAQGLTKITGWSVGLATFVVSVTVLLLWVPLRQTPGIGTILNIIVISVVLDLALPWLPRFDSLALRIAEAAAGVIVTGIGGGIYLIANLGPGPRDGLMTGLQRLTGFPIAWVRGAIEIGAVVLGWSLGGVAGIGTLLFAFGIGPCVAATMYGLQRIFGSSQTSPR
jgi:uncharacterized membrane protein YczE